MAEAGLERELAALASAVRYPPTPPLAPTVVARLETERAAGVRPVVPARARWTRRRTLALAAAALALLLAAAFTARYVIGAAEVRVRPGVTPSGPPVDPDDLGTPVALEDLPSAVGFSPSLPPGPPPDDAYAVTTADGAGALLAWSADAGYGELPGTRWGLLLLVVRSDAEVVTKDVNRFEDLRDVRVAGDPAFWIDAPHELILATAEGDAHLRVEANVLIWERDGLTYRLETSLPVREAIALAAAIG